MAGVSTATGFAANVASNVLSGLWNGIVEEVKMVVSLPQAVIAMEGEAKRLNNVIDGIRAELTRQQRPPQRIVGAWLDKADEAMEISGAIRNEYQQSKNCLGCIPNCLSRYRISRDIRDWKGKVAQLHSERESDFPPRTEYGDFTPPTQIPIQNSESGFVANAIRSAQTKRVETWLADKESSIRRIGIQGMGGVGKTSLLDAINDSEEVRNSFDLIIKVTVSRNDILDLQKCVAHRLNLTLPDYFEGRKDMLRSYLKNKNYLLLLDDMWAEDLWTVEKLQSLGVSLNDTGFKFLLTTRDKQVCGSMHVQEMITVEPLLEEEGWELFRSGAFKNQNGNVPQELEEVARKVAKECKGLPLAIIVVAAAMAHHSYLHEWELALDQMQNVDKTFYDLHPGVDTQLFQRLKWSYNALTDYLKACFLYFAAYPEDRVIICDEVIDMWIAEGFVKGSEDSYLNDIGHSYISHLRDRCLIEVVQTDVVGRICRVKIHDVLRDLAILIGEKEHRCYFKAGRGVRHFPVEEGWARISLMNNRLYSLQTTFVSSSLSVLMLRKNPDIKEVPESFLCQLPLLKVLDLSETGITSLPPSIGNLKQLVSLQLSACKGIRELPETIGDLNNLQFLNLTSCYELRCLPKRVSELKRLRSLEMTDCRSLIYLPRGISELVSLERLYIGGSSLDFEEDANAETNYLCLKDLQSLRRLRHFSVLIKSSVKEGLLGNWLKMRVLSVCFTGFPGNHEYLPQDMRAMKDLESLWLHGCHLERLPSPVSEFRKLAFLSLIGWRQLKELPAELPCLRALEICRCDKLKELELGMGFPKLEVLVLRGLESLECVRAGTAASGSGGRPLECVRAGTAASGRGGRPSPLPMFWNLVIDQCSQLKRLSGEWDKLKCLERIVGRRKWWDAIECDDPNIKTSLGSKFRTVGMQ